MENMSGELPLRGLHVKHGKHALLGHAAHHELLQNIILQVTVDTKQGKGNQKT